MPCLASGCTGRARRRHVDLGAEPLAELPVYAGVTLSDTLVPGFAPTIVYLMGINRQRRPNKPEELGNNTECAPHDSLLSYTVRGFECATARWARTLLHAMASADLDVGNSQSRIRLHRANNKCQTEM